MAKFSGLMGESLHVLGYTAIVLYGSLALHLLLCKRFGIDADTAIITSTAAIFGPAFIGPVASRLNNPQMVVSGLSSGLVGYAAGTYLGILMAWLLAGGLP